MTTLQCPFCERDFVRKYSLYRHALTVHWDVDVAGSNSALMSSPNGMSNTRDWLVWCWCGFFTRKGVAGMTEHWDRDGGLHSHILHVGLGVYREN